ncbi:hypothetical protein N7532_009335 [Penicillium argentinense]|uniref:DNA ligase D 3'-phosphoesterase domain-containing protein n=1 Tax=Penicillium argentinense TaxID=1131581 RepID=A0A9W9EZD8_9EURO|nr:uncharacterized protein N7532_009335 [Penicillium argentinense]KAJ5090651.1 hypothetical protein N7532_009335 [Penicillium argentinense]
MKRSRTSPLSHSPHSESNRAPHLSSLQKSVSPPPKRRGANGQDGDNPHPSKITPSDPKTSEYLDTWSMKLRKSILPASEQGSTPHLPIDQWVDLYRRHAHSNGHHFVIHQHDHPVAGPHYDLRLQFSDSSTVCWAIMYGLPGDPNQDNRRNATETRIHGLSYNLAETASLGQGSVIIWDTGDFQILPYRTGQDQPDTDDTSSDGGHAPAISESSKLRDAFQRRKIKVRLNGIRLPKNYTISLVRQNKHKPGTGTGTGKTSLKNRRRPAARMSPSPPTDPDSMSPPSPRDPEPKRGETTLQEETDLSDGDDREIRETNAYPGSFNTIGSVHGRTWYLRIDTVGSGFRRVKSRDGKQVWVRNGGATHGATRSIQGFEPFYVLGPEVERSVVTGRLGKDVLDDEGVQDFVPRRGWVPKA